MASKNRAIEQDDELQKLVQSLTLGSEGSQGSSKSDAPTHKYTCFQACYPSDKDVHAEPESIKTRQEIVWPAKILEWIQDVSMGDENCYRIKIIDVPPTKGKGEGLDTLCPRPRSAVKISEAVVKACGIEGEYDLMFFDHYLCVGSWSNGPGTRCIATRTKRTLEIRYNIVCHFPVRNMTLILLKCRPEQLISDKVEEIERKIESVERIMRQSFDFRREAYLLKKENTIMQVIVKKILVFDPKRLDKFGLDAWNPEDVIIRRVQLVAQDSAALYDSVKQHRNLLEMMKDRVLLLREIPVDTAEDTPA